MPYKIKTRVFHERRLYEPGEIINDESVAAALGDDVEAVETPKQPSQGAQAQEDGETSNAVEGRETKPAKKIVKK